MGPITTKFKQMGVDAKIYAPEDRPRQNRLRGGRIFNTVFNTPAIRDGNIMRIDVVRDNKTGNPYFDICTNLHLQVLDIEPKEKHLVLMARTNEGEKQKYLCGFDERGWFAAALPETPKARDRRGISSVQSAKDSLKPKEVRDAEDGKRMKRRKRNQRVNKASKRQGEWFFVPARKLDVNEELILINEPIQMGGKRKHICQEVYRTGGEKVWVGRHYRNGITEDAYRNLSPNIRSKEGFRQMTRDAEVYARGAIKAPDHDTLYLDGWHRVIPNTEGRAAHAEKVVFLD